VPLSIRVVVPVPTITGITTFGNTFPTVALLMLSLSAFFVFPDALCAGLQRGNIPLTITGSTLGLTGNTVVTVGAQNCPVISATPSQVICTLYVSVLVLACLLALDSRHCAM
jgi:hypothetical protein